jgi:nitric oxide synthase-interacting protein
VDDEDEEGEGRERAATVKKLASAVGERTTKEQLSRTSYWVPQFAPGHIAEKIAEPPKRPPSPTTGEGLRMKDLFAVNLIVDPDTAGTLDKKYQCAVTQKQITFQDAVLLKKPANAVVLASVYRDLVAPTMTCPITGQKLKPKDVVRLVKAGSSFAAAGSVKAEKYTHSVT